ncbi:MAG: divergent polysaccharide deacetylase family protein [Candidatus Geothermincolia bacterium]
MDESRDRGSGSREDEPRRELEQRRADRLAERRRRVRRNRGIAVAVAVALIIGVAILVSPWGPLKGSIYGTRKVAKKAEAKTDTSNKKTTAGTTPKTSTPVATAPMERKSVKTPPTIAIVVDDVGNRSDKLKQWLTIDAPLTFAVMPYPPLSQQLAEQLYQNGYVVIMHIPTDNAPPNSFSGTGQLATGMDRATVFSTLDNDSLAVPHMTGINNHQGGRGCDQLDLMTYEVEWAKSKGMFVVDSNSSVNSQVTPACLALGLPKRKNEVFIDHQLDPNYIRGAMRELAAIARKNGTAIGICHWHRDNTVEVVSEMVRTLKAEGINFAFARDISN